MLVESYLKRFFYSAKSCLSKRRDNNKKNTYPIKESKTVHIFEYLRAVLFCMIGALIAACIWGGCVYFTFIYGFDKYLGIVGVGGYFICECFFNIMSNEKSTRKHITVMLCVIISVIFGQYLGECFKITHFIFTGEYSVAYSRVPSLALLSICQRKILIPAVYNICSGIVFALFTFFCRLFFRRKVK